MNHKKSGIYKGVSEAVYPDDILSDQELMGSDLATIGAWCGKVLTVMWRQKPKAGQITDTIEGFGHFWGCDVTEVERIIGVIEARKIGTVSRDSRGNVTLTCRRLSRRHKASEEARLRKQSERGRRKGHADVTGQKPSPSSPSPYSYPPSSSVPDDVGLRSPAAGDPEMQVWITQFKNATGFTKANIIRDQLEWLRDHCDDVSKAISDKATPGMTPWEFRDKVVGKLSPVEEVANAKAKQGARSFDQAAGQRGKFEGIGRRIQVDAPARDSKDVPQGETGGLPEPESQPGRA